MIERNNSFIHIKHLPIGILVPRHIQIDVKADHLSHFTPVRPINPANIFGREPPDKAMVNLPFLSIESF